MTISSRCPEQPSAHSLPANRHPEIPRSSPFGSGSAGTLVVIPARNEAATIAAVVREVRRATGYPVLVVDDASTDATGPLAREAGAEVLSLVTNLGAWGAIQTGLRYGVRYGHEVVLTMDGDGQHLAASIPDLLRPLVEGRADVAIGACTRRGSPARRLAWRFFRRLSGLAIGDLTSGFRAYNRRAMKLLASSEATLLEYQDLGVLLLLRDCGLRLEEVAVSMEERVAGSSRVYPSWLAVGYYLAYTGVLCMSKRPYWTEGRRAGPGRKGAAA